MARRRYPWPENAGPYRTVDDLVHPWIPSPMSSSPDMTSNPPPIRIDSKQPRSRMRYRRGERRTFWSRLVRLFTKKTHFQPPPQTDFDDKPPMRRLLPSDWRAFAYWSCPIVNNVPVRNATPGPISPTGISPQRVFRNLRGPRGSPHPENWISGLRHPALPTRPALWKIPRLGDPLPFPWEVQINPFLEHRFMGVTPLYFNIGRPPSSICFGESENAITLEQSDRAQPATYPLLTHMHIIAVADDTAPIFPWPVMVHNRTGIKCQDVFENLYVNFQQYVTQQEFDSWSPRRQEMCARAYFARNPRALSAQSDDGLRRIDYLCDRVMFRGLEPCPNKDASWVLFLGLA